MNKENLVMEISKETGLTQKDTLLVIDSFIKQIRVAYLKRFKIELRGLGTFSTTFRSARNYKDARSGKIKSMKERWSFKYKASKAFLGELK